MLRDPAKYKNIQDRLDSMRTRPTVGLFVDVDSVCVESLPEEMTTDTAISNALLEVARSSGRVVHACMYYEDGSDLDPPINPSVWIQNGFSVHRTPSDATTAEGINLPMMFDVYEYIRKQHLDVCILAVGASNYNALAKRVISNGSAVVMVSNYPRELRSLPKESCIYVPLQSIATTAPTTRTYVRNSTTPAAKNYNLNRFIRLLADSEELMPFVGAQFFVTRVMWRLKELPTHEVRQAVFQEAAESGVIEIYNKDNIDGSDNAVSACRLNRQHPTVIAALAEELDERDVDRYEATTDRHGDTPTRKVVVTVDAQPDTNLVPDLQGDAIIL